MKNAFFKYIKVIHRIIFNHLLFSMYVNTKLPIKFFFLFMCLSPQENSKNKENDFISS